MKLNAFAGRNRKEIFRDPLSLLFGFGLPLFLLGLVRVVNSSIPGSGPEIFRIENFAPGVAVFSFAFISLFAGMLIAKDRMSSFLTRLFASPLTPKDYLLGYALPLLPMALLQCAVCFAAAIFMGLQPNINILYATLSLLPAAIFFIAFGLLLGSIFTDKQVGGFFSIFAQLAALGSGMWFDLALVGGTVKAIAYALPFSHAFEAAKAALAGNFFALPAHLAWVVAYALGTGVCAALVFRKKMKQ
ncbi:MAG: ABC transporter permease [Oscillospiraceae bacterium]|jgi:ABC-2 type transport system permease protein|nr:ABC transporter permease [Oscillospiraceae bacterium]